MADDCTGEANSGNGLFDKDGFLAEVKADHIRLYNWQRPGSIDVNQGSGARLEDNATIEFQVNRGAG